MKDEQNKFGEHLIWWFQTKIAKFSARQNLYE